MFFKIRLANHKPVLNVFLKIIFFFEILFFLSLIKMDFSSPLK
jgi:hypothetical protein